jgi:acyl carrier protein
MPATGLEIESRVIHLLNDRFNRQRVAVGPETTLRFDLRINAGDMLDLWTELESEFGVGISEREFENLDCVSEIVELITGKKRPN